MPTYHPKAIEPCWQKFWEEHKVFRTPDVSAKPKFYILDMFPYPSGAGLHVGHPEGYTATDILARYQRMKGFNVLHPMGWDAFGLPAEQYAIETGTHPRETTQRNIATFRRQIKMLGFSYDWDREIDTTDPKYFQWTQWIFLQLFDTWYDAEQKRGRPIAELAIPPEVAARGAPAVDAYRDSKRLAYQAEVPVNWCPALGTVLANEEVVDGKSERGGHPVARMPLRQWLLRITAYAERLLKDLDRVEWPESIKKMQRDWIGRSEGAEVDFALEAADGGLPPIRVFTTRPDTLFGATYMVLAPEHPLVERIVTESQRPAIELYRAEATRKSDLERTELAKRKTGVFTGAFAVNPVNGESIPVWIADYVLQSYGTGAIMAVPAHDERDWEFARQFKLPIRPVLVPPRDWLEGTKVFEFLQEQFEEKKPAKSAVNPVSGDDSLPATLSLKEMTILKKGMSLWKRHRPDLGKVLEQLYLNHLEHFSQAFTGDGTAVNSGRFDGLSTAEFKEKITRWLEERGQGQPKVNYKLRDWLFSRQRYWGEPFPILHELDSGGAGSVSDRSKGDRSDGEPAGQVRALDEKELPLTLPDLEDFKPSGKPEPPLGKATGWVRVTRDGKRYLRETNTMPQWAGSCWYYLRFIDPANEQAFCDPAKEKQWMPVDLYVGGAEHAVLHLLYARFWHKVLFDRGHVHTPEPFQRLVNQGMILGEMEYTAYRHQDRWISAVKDASPEWETVRLEEDQVEKQGECFVLKEDPKVRVEARAYKMSKSRGNVINPDQVVDEYGADSMRLYEMFMGPLEATKPWSMRSVEGVFRFLNRVWRLVIDERSEEVKLADQVKHIDPDKETLRKLHQTIKKVTEDLDAMSFNTAISAMMELSNLLTRQEARPRSLLNTLVLLLSPFAPHLAEELWRALGHDETLAYEPWPAYEEVLTREDEIEVPVQINGKVRAKITVSADIDEPGLEKAALKLLADEKIKGLIEGKVIKKIIVVPKKLVNIVCQN